MIYYLVVGICIILLLAVIYVSAKPISMGIEARRNITHNNKADQSAEEDYEYPEINNEEENNISDEIIKLNQLKNDGILTEEEYTKAKKKLLG